MRRGLSRASRLGPRAGQPDDNATVAELATALQGRKLKLRYQDGKQTVAAPDRVSIATFKAGDRSLLVLGARVLVTAQTGDGKPVALRAIAGRGGFAPPM